MPRPTAWFYDLANDQAVAASGQLTIRLASALSAGVIKGATITRIVGFLNVVPDLVNEHAHHFWGIAMVAGEAVAAMAFPEPDDENERVAWMWRDGGSTTMSDLFDKSQEVTYRFDIGSQRIYRDELQQCRLIFNQSAGGGVFVSFGIRVLVRLR